MAETQIEANDNPPNNPEPAREERDNEMEKMVGLVSPSEDDRLTTWTIGLPLLSCHVSLRRTLESKDHRSQAFSCRPAFIRNRRRYHLVLAVWRTKSDIIGA
jgi:hypothetical protein